MTIMIMMTIITMTDDYNDHDDYDDYHESFPRGGGQASLSDAGKFGQYQMTIMNMMTCDDIIV